MMYYILIFLKNTLPWFVIAMFVVGFLIHTTRLKELVYLPKFRHYFGRNLGNQITV